ncbi:MAG: lysylphosphatidylglycerol synthase transmembrane domain-containing protein [Cyclobacteriaceae bacterium]
MKNWLPTITEQKKRTISVAVRVILTGIAIWFVARKVNLPLFSSIILNLEWSWFLVAVGAWLLSRLAAGWRTGCLLNGYGLRLAPVTNMKLMFKSSLYNTVLPGGITGDAVKGIYLHRWGSLTPKKIIMLLAIDRGSGLWAVLVLLAALLVFKISAGDFRFFFWGAGFLSLSLYMKWLLMRWLQAPVGHFFWNITVASLCVQLLQVAGSFFTLRSMQVTAGTIDYLFAFLVSSLASVIPVSVGGAGVREVTFVLIEPWMGSTYVIETGVALGLLLFLINLLSVLPGLFLKLPDPGSEVTLVARETTP